MESIDLDGNKEKQEHEHEQFNKKVEINEQKNST